MDWTTLISVVIGGLIATIPILINNKFQSIEHDKDREEKRREAHIQLALELKRNDIKIIEEAIDNSLKTLDILEIIRIKNEMGKITQAEMQEEIAALTFDENNRFAHLGEQNLIDEKIAYSLGDEFYAEYKEFISKFEENLRYAANSATFSLEDADELHSILLKSSAKLHNILRDKLLSVRDT
jgi:hypothetical protein